MIHNTSPTIVCTVIDIIVALPSRAAAILYLRRFRNEIDRSCLTSLINTCMRGGSFRRQACAPAVNSQLPEDQKMTNSHPDQHPISLSVRTSLGTRLPGDILSMVLP